MSHEFTQKDPQNNFRLIPAFLHLPLLVFIQKFSRFRKKMIKVIQTMNQVAVEVTLLAIPIAIQTLAQSLLQAQANQTMNK